MGTTAIDTLLAVLLSGRKLVGREETEKRLRIAFLKESYSSTLVDLVVEGFKFREFALNLRDLLQRQNERLHAAATERDRLLWEPRERARLARERIAKAWTDRWDASYWKPGEPVYEHYRKLEK